MKKKLCILVLALCMTASVTGCTSKKDTTSNTGAETEESKNASKEETAQNDSQEESEEVTEDTRIVSVAADQMDQ